MTPAAICFDATGTLIETAEGVGEVYHRIAVEFGVDLPAWRLEDAFHRVLRSAPTRGVAGDTIDARRTNELEWWLERIRQTFQATDSTARFVDFRTFGMALFEAYRVPDAWRPRAGVVEMLTALRTRDCRLAVTSNFDHRLPEILEGLDLSMFFELIVTPSEIGVAKPDRAVFGFVATAFECAIEHLVYVGDDARETLDEIGKLGLHVIDIREIEDPRALPDLIVTAATLPRRSERRHGRDRSQERSPSR